MVHTHCVTVAFLGLQGGKSRCFDPCCSKGGLSLGWGKWWIWIRYITQIESYSPYALVKVWCFWRGYREHGNRSIWLHRLNSSLCHDQGGDRIPDVASLLVFSTLAILMSVGHLSEFVGQAERERKGFSEQDCLGEGKSVNFLKGNLLNDRKSFRTSLPWTKLTKIWEACNSATVCWRFHRLKGWRVVLYLLPPIQLHWPAFVQGKDLVGSTWNCWRHPQQHATNASVELMNFAFENHLFLEHQNGQLVYLRGDTEKLQTFLAAVFALHPMLQERNLKWLSCKAVF